MAARLLGSVKDSYNVLYRFAHCSRRKPESNPSQTLIGSASRSPEVLTERHYDSDDTTMSTETGDFSNTEFSDKSNLSDGSIDGPSCQDTPSTEMPSRSRFSAQTRQGLHAPPGLEGLQNYLAIGQAPQCTGVCVFNTESKSLQLRHSISMLREALEAWEADLENSSSPGIPSVALESSSLLALQGALSKMIPQGAATVNSPLACKMALNTTPTSVTNSPAGKPRQFRFPARSHPGSLTAGQAHGLFASLPGASAERVHVVKPSRIPRYTKPQNVTLPAGTSESLSSHLGDLSQMDSACVLMVRKINRLGLSASGPLENYFSQFGKVERVMVAPTRSNAGQKVRVRASPQGFVVMSRAEEAQAALGCGVEHIIQGECICAYPFERRGASVTK